MLGAWLKSDRQSGQLGAPAAARAKRGLGGVIRVQAGRGFAAAGRLQFLQDVVHMVLEGGGADRELAISLLERPCPTSARISVSRSHSGGSGTAVSNPGFSGYRLGLAVFADILWSAHVSFDAMARQQWKQQSTSGSVNRDLQSRPARFRHQLAFFYDLNGANTAALFVTRVRLGNVVG
jgi:hypothetical protein